MTRKLRGQINKGDLLSIAEGLASTHRDEMFKSMVAMEMSGLSKRMLTNDKQEQSWVKVPDKQ